MSFQATHLELNYLLDLFKEIKEGLDEGVLSEIDQAIEMIEGWKQELTEGLSKKVMIDLKDVLEDLEKR
jgi:hypothetical protein